MSHGTRPAPTPDSQDPLRTFVAGCDPQTAILVRALRALVLAVAPGCTERINDTTIVFGQRATFCTVTRMRDRLRVRFLHGAALPDPARLLAGNGRQSRHTDVAGPRDLSESLARLLRSAGAAA